VIGLAWMVTEYRAEGVEMPCMGAKWCRICRGVFWLRIVKYRKDCGWS
jgi:hypothetical protein